MHSRIFVLRQVRDDVKLPSMENITYISEEELYRRFTYYCDYVIKQKSSSWHEDIQWLCHVDDMFDMHKDNDHNIIGADVASQAQNSKDCDDHQGNDGFHLDQIGQIFLQDFHM